MIELRGMTWNHTRGYLPMVATAQRFSELRPDVRIVWEKRPLQEFADFPLERLVDSFDLLVIDHPFAGFAATHGALLRLDDHIPTEFLADQAANSVGRSHESYAFGGHQWGLATDAAAPVSGYRPDLLAKAGVGPPRTWSQLLAVARRGLVAVSGVAIDSLCHFYMLCEALGEEPFTSQDVVVGQATGTRALEMLRELMRLSVPGCSERNPIAVWELLTSSDSAAFCPFAYGYSNYARPRYSKHPLRFGGLVTIDGAGRCRSTLGGAGLAISSQCRHIPESIEYSLFTVSPWCQAGVYFESGGQPGHRSAWLDSEVNRASNSFFLDTLATLDEAWMRPRWNGYLDFQGAAGPIVHQYLWGTGEAGKTLEALNALLKRSGVKEFA